MKALYFSLKRLFVLFLTTFLIFGPVCSLAFPVAEDFPDGWRLNPNFFRDIANVITIHDPDGSGKGDSYVHLTGHLTADTLRDVGAGDKIHVSFYARDPERSEVQLVLYAYERSEPGAATPYITTLSVVTEKAGADWKKITGSVVIPETLRGRRVRSVKPTLIAPTGAYFSFPETTHIRVSVWQNHEDAYYFGMAGLQSRDYSQALEDFRSSLGLAKTSEERKKAEYAIERTEELKELQVAGADIRRADALLEVGRHEEARALYSRIYDETDLLQVRVMALFARAGSFLRQEDYARAQRTYREIESLDGLGDYYRIYTLFRQAEAYMLQSDYHNARRLYTRILTEEGATEHHLFKAQLNAGDIYKSEGRYSQARSIYKLLLSEQNASSFPHDGYRLELSDRLEAIEGLVDGASLRNARQMRAERVNSPARHLYVAVDGSDSNPGTRLRPLASISGAQSAIRRIKREEGLPEGGIAVYLRGGRYFLEESVSFSAEDSGKPGSPVVYRSYPGEQARLIGGRDITGLLEPLKDPAVLGRIPESARDKILTADLKSAGITEYGELLNRGASGVANISAIELFYNGEPMELSRWPKERWLRAQPTGEDGKFYYHEDRPLRWADENDIWSAGFYYWVFFKLHTGVDFIDTQERIVHLQPDRRRRPGQARYLVAVVPDAPYYFYNILAELSEPGEFYIDRETGKLYFYPPSDIRRAEAIISTLNTPIIKGEGISDIIFYDLTLEGTWHSGMEIHNGNDILIAGCTIRNTGQYAVIMHRGLNNGLVGCDIYGTGEGGIQFRGTGKEYTDKLVPVGHYVENNHIHHFNRFDAGYRPAVSIMDFAVGVRISHNLIHDSPHQVVSGNQTSFNNTIIEYNEIYDVVHEPRDAGAIYAYCNRRYLMNRGNVIRNNFIHHITEHSSPGKTHQAIGIFMDALNAGWTIADNVLYMCTNRAVYTHGSDNRIENNVFIDCLSGIVFDDRSYLLDPERLARDFQGRLKRSENALAGSRFKQPPWSVWYPQLTGILEESLPLGRTENNIIERNVNTGGPFISLHRSLKPLLDSGKMDWDSNKIIRNWEYGDPLFYDLGNMDFRIIPGSPVFGETGHQPVSFEKIGLYEDPLRASWPVERAPAGKYIMEHKIPR